MKSFLSLNLPDNEFNSSKVDSNHSMFQAYASNPYGEPVFVYGPHAINQPLMLPKMLGLSSGRVALPLDLAEDGTIFVNAKQYHGILRRRQSRAKLEAQNKLIKNRKPYLHESRHRHALNRVRGSGGRFLSSKQLAQSNTELVTGAHSGSDPPNIYQKEHQSELESHSSKPGDNASSITTCSDRLSLSSNSVVNFRQPECTFLGNSTNMGGATQFSGGLTFAGTKQRASVVR